MGAGNRSLDPENLKRAIENTEKRIANIKDKNPDADTSKLEAHLKKLQDDLAAATTGA